MRRNKFGFIGISHVVTKGVGIYVTEIIDTSHTIVFSELILSHKKSKLN
jgi:hypothetical protein